jgi:hypothetical protein
LLLSLSRVSKLIAIADRHDLPLAICAESASPAEVKLVSQTLGPRFVAGVPEKLVGDKGYDSNRLDAELLGQFGADMNSVPSRGRPDPILGSRAGRLSCPKALAQSLRFF